MKLCKAGRDHYELTQHFAEQWANPPRGFNASYDAVKQDAIKRKERAIKDKLNAYHTELKHVPNDEYYDLMDAYELKLRNAIM
jgi:hypothetical protein